VQVYSPGVFRHGLRLIYHCPHTTCACALGCAGFFTCAGNCKHSHHFPTDIVDHFQIAPCGSLLDWPSLSTPLATFQVHPSSQQFLYSDFRIAYLPFTFSRPSPTIFHYSDFRITYNNKRWIRTNTWCMNEGLDRQDSQWIASCRHHQVHKYVPSLVTSSLHMSRSLYPVYATPHFFILQHRECALLCSFSHQPPLDHLLIL